MKFHYQTVKTIKSDQSFEASKRISEIAETLEEKYSFGFVPHDKTSQDAAIALAHAIQGDGDYLATSAYNPDLIRVAPKLDKETIGQASTRLVGDKLSDQLARDFGTYLEIGGKIGRVDDYLGTWLDNTDSENRLLFLCHQSNSETELARAIRSAWISGSVSLLVADRISVENGIEGPTSYWAD